MPWRDEERTQRSAINPRLGMDTPPPSVSDGRYPPRGYEPARRNPPSAMSAAPDNFMARTDSTPGMRGASVTGATDYTRATSAGRQAESYLQRTLPPQGSMVAPVEPRAQQTQTSRPRTRTGTIYPEVARDWDRVQGEFGAVSPEMIGANIRGGLALGTAGLLDAGDAMYRWGIKPVERFGRSLLGMDPVEQPASRTPSPSATRRSPTTPTPTSATGRSFGGGDDFNSGAISPLVDVPDLEAAAKRSATGRAGMGNIMPREYAPSAQFPGAYESGVAGIGVRRGPSNELEFFDAGGFKDPIRKGENTVNYVPAGSLANITTPQATTDAVRAAAARGDWSALERTGRMAPRSGGAVGGAMGGAPRIQAPDQFAQAEQLRKQAQSLYQQAGRVRGGSNKSPLIREANMLSSMAESLIGAGATMSGQQAALDQEAMKQNTALEKALTGEPLTALDMANAEKAMADAGHSRAKIAEIMAKLESGETQGLLPFDVSADDMQFLTQVLGPKGVQEFGLKALSDAQFAQQLEQLQKAGSLAELKAAHDAGRNLPPEVTRLMREVGIIDDTKGMAMGGLVENDYSYEDGGFVDDPMMLDPEMMGLDQGMPEMGAMDSMGLGMGMGEPQADPVQMEYEQYAQVAESMGLPVIPFEQFAQIMQQAQQPEMPPDAGAVNLASGGLVPTRNQFGFEMDPQTGRSPVGQAGWERYNSAVGGNNAMRQQAEENNYSGAKKFARGGPVDVGGKMVVDPDPAAATDSIPAMIDGQQPAALDSGEFVIPRHAVMFHGIDKLTKLIAQADQNGSGPGQAPRG